MLPAIKNFLEQHRDKLEDVEDLLYQATLEFTDPLEMQDLINILQETSILREDIRHKVLDTLINEIFEKLCPGERDDLNKLIAYNYCSLLAYSRTEVRNYILEYADKWEDKVSIYPHPTWEAHWVVERK